MFVVLISVYTMPAVDDVYHLKANVLSTKMKYALWFSSIIMNPTQKKKTPLHPEFHPIIR